MKIYRLTSNPRGSVTQRTYAAGVKVVAEVPDNQGGVRKWALGGDDFVRIQFSLDEPIYLNVGDFILIQSPLDANMSGLEEYGDAYALTEQYVPTFNETTGGYDYDVQFDAYWKLLANVTAMLSYRPDGETRPVRYESRWKYTENLTGHADILQNNIIALGFAIPQAINGNSAVMWLPLISVSTRMNAWSSAVYEADIADFVVRNADGGNQRNLAQEHRYVEYEGLSILDALKKLQEEDCYNCEMWYEASPYFVIHLGHLGHKMTQPDRDAERGVVIAAQRGDAANADKHALQVTPQNSEKEYFTRLRLFGSTNNIPDTYGKKLVLKYKSGGDWPFYDGTGGVVRTPVVWFNHSSYESEVVSTEFSNAIYIENQGYPAETPFSVTEDAYTQLPYDNGGDVELRKIVLHFSTTGSNHYANLIVQSAWQIGETYNPTGNWRIFHQLSFATSSGPMQDAEATLPLFNRPKGANKIWVRTRLIMQNAIFHSYDPPTESINPVIYGTLETRRVDKIIATASLTGVTNDQTNGDTNTITLIGSSLPELQLLGSEISYELSEVAEDGTDWILEGVDTTNFPSSLFHEIDSVAVYGSSSVDRRLRMMQDGVVQPYAEAEGYGGLLNHEIVEKVDIDENFYPRVEMENGTVGLEASRTSAATLYEYHHSAPRGQWPDEGNQQDSWPLVKEYQDGSKKKEYYEYFILDDTNETGILDGNDGITEEWLISGETLRVHFNTGVLAGMEFEGLIERAAGKPRVIAVIPNENYGQVLPNGTLYPCTGDEYVLLGWNPTRISDTDAISKAGELLYLEAQERVNDAVRDHKTYQVRMDAMSVAEVQHLRWNDSTPVPIDDSDGLQMYTRDKHYASSGILAPGTRVRLSDVGLFEKTRDFSADGTSVSVLNCSELLRIVGLEYKLDFPFDGLVYTIGETPVLKGNINTLKKKIR